MSYLYNLYKNHVAELPVKVSFSKLANGCIRMTHLLTLLIFLNAWQYSSKRLFRKKNSIFVKGMPCMLKGFPGKQHKSVQNVPLVRLGLKPAYSLHGNPRAQAGCECPVLCVSGPSERTIELQSKENSGSDASLWNKKETQEDSKVEVSVKAQSKLWLWEHYDLIIKPVNLYCPRLAMFEHFLRSSVDLNASRIIE